MEVMAYATDTDQTPAFATLLWRYMQSSGEGRISHKEVAARLTKAGFKASDNNVSQWLTGQRTPPPGLPFYTTLALGLEVEDGQALAWAYSRSYKDNRKGAGLSGTRVADMAAGQTLEHVRKIAAKRGEYDKRTEEMRRVKDHQESGDRTGDRN